MKLNRYDDDDGGQEGLIESKTRDQRPKTKEVFKKGEASCGRVVK